MKEKTIIGLVITCLLYSLPVLSMDLRDDRPQKNAPQIPITIGKETTNRHRSNNPIVIEAYYQSGYVVIDFCDVQEAAIVTLSNDANDTIEYFVNPLDDIVLIDINNILSDGTFYIQVLTESGEVYWGRFVL